MKTTDLATTRRTSATKSTAPFTAFLLAASALPVGMAAPEPRPGINYDEAKVAPYTLPDPLVTADGSRIRDAQTWRAKRRPEMLELFAREIYGRTPGGQPAGMHWAVTSSDRHALGGKAVRKEITVWFTGDKKGPKMHLLVYQPPGEAGCHAPWPAFLGLNFYGNQSVHADPGITMAPGWMRPNEKQKIVNNRASARGTHAESWHIEAVVARGYATATVHYADLCEDRPEGLTSDVGKVFETAAMESRKPDEWGAIGMWAWGLSRALDVLQDDREIDGRRVAVHGHSRLGKAALWAGAQDERFAMVISNNSGCGGAALSMRDFGETVKWINTSFPHWFAKAFRAYNGREAALPVDQHVLLSLIAPRPLHVGSAEDDEWADPRGEFLATKHAEPVYALFGRKGLGVAEWPAVNHPVLGDGLAYHYRTGEHRMTPYDWERYMEFADRVMKSKVLHQSADLGRRMTLFRGGKDERDGATQARSLFGFALDGDQPR